MFFVSFIISNMTILIHSQAEAERLTEQQTFALYTLSRQLAKARGSDKLLNIGIEYIAMFFNSDVLVFLPENEQLVMHGKNKTDEFLDAKEINVAQWVFDMGQNAGFGTDTLPNADALYLPLLGSHNVMGVMRIHFKKQEILAPDQMRLLESCANQIAVALEVDKLHEQSKTSQCDHELDRIRNILHQLLSRELSTPLTALNISANTLMERKTKLDKEEANLIGSHIYFEVEQLRSLITNLLQISNFT
jgi:two-component system sensor histidine kinase KdpD